MADSIVCIKITRRISTAEITAKWDSPAIIGNFTEIYCGTVIGCKRIVPLENVSAKAIRIKITDSRTAPHPAFPEIYKGGK